MTDLEPWQEKLSSLSASARRSGFTNATWEETRQYANKFIQTSIALDLATVGLAADQADLMYDAHWSEGARDAIDRLGTLPVGAPHFFSDNQLLGFTNAISGSWFEQLVATLANDGLIDLPKGADHVILAGRTQEGWDLILMRGDDAVGEAQVKFSVSGATISRHLHDHADIPIVITNHEAAMAAQNHGYSVIDAHVDYGSIHDPVSNEVARHFGVDHTIHEWLPIFALLVIMGKAVAMIDDGEEYEKVKSWAIAEAGIAGVANAGATVASILAGTEAIRLPVAMTVRSFFARGRVGKRTVRVVEACQQLLRGIHSPAVLSATE